MEEKKQHISDWLERLQQESWNLELLVSGFSIFLLMQTYDLIIDGIRYLNIHFYLSDYYSVYLDSVKVETEMYFYTHPNKKEKGIYTLLDLVDLKRGKHLILIKRKKVDEEDNVEEIDYTRIPFWKE